MASEKKAAESKDAVPADGRKPYRLRDGGKFYDCAQRDDEARPLRIEPGSIVLLTDAQAVAFRDMFDPA